MLGGGKTYGKPRERNTYSINYIQKGLSITTSLFLFSVQLSRQKSCNK